ncbi:uncharacterized protein THITE_115778 [Thermothielavioides terrestris NRRL 8126]|uniref:Uncharacterized protein n=1 Tax=Thermothielavioides terrestris (strain ATCC 38088 / NRRL 8126) TaxID=578455 RepID=G2QRA7_THETT|nr:uncharacterized protein THITE_115778 [Thermothielavioides terrestris NRRL 8126]AEO64159.1 hypothetical protein THITE_115778 [Thermothielavioides terrestris NRRL 8126]
MAAEAGHDIVALPLLTVPTLAERRMTSGPTRKTPIPGPIATHTLCRGSVADDRLLKPVFSLGSFIMDWASSPDCSCLTVDLALPLRLADSLTDSAVAMGGVFGYNSHGETSIGLREASTIGPDEGGGSCCVKCPFLRSRIGQAFMNDSITVSRTLSTWIDLTPLRQDARPSLTSPATDEVATVSRPLQRNMNEADRGADRARPSESARTDEVAGAGSSTHVVCRERIPDLLDTTVDAVVLTSAGPIEAKHFPSDAP